MKTVCLTPSANWYSAGAVASDGDGLLVACCRSAVLVAGLTEQEQRPAAAPSPQFHGLIEDAHRERVTGAAVWRPPAGPVHVVSCGEDGLVKLWLCAFAEQESGFKFHCEKQHNGHGKLKVVAMDHAARVPHQIVSVDERGSFVVWDTVAHTTRTLFLERLAATELRCSPHSEHVVAVAGRRGLLWTVSLSASGRILQKMRGHDDDVTSISWCPELTTLLSFQQDHLLVSASKDKTLRVWGTRGGRCHVTQRVTGGNGSRRAPSGERTWLAVLWTSADTLYSGGLSGQLLRWRLTQDDDNCLVVHRLHGRGLFNIVRLGRLVVSSGIERQLVVHDPITHLTSAVPCLGGHVNVLHGSPVDPGRLAIGCGDSTIRVWNLSSENPYCITSIWQGIKAKVLTVAWHPEKDSRLAFGTDEGRVGVCDPSCGRPPLLCSDHHAGPVYSVSWAPDGALFSLSLGAVWRHEPTRLAAAPWPPAAGRAPCSQLSWGGGGAALGCQDGAVELLSAAGGRRAAALGHRRLITAIRWGQPPEPAAAGTTPMAVASYDSHVSVFDVPDLDGSGCPDLLQPRVTLTGHRSRVLDLAWSPHTFGCLVSASQDGSVRVWDTDAGSLVAVYGGHRRPVRCCLPHPLLPGRVFSGGDDCCVHLWNIDQQGTTLPDKMANGVDSSSSVGQEDKPKHKKKKPSATELSSTAVEASDAVGDAPPATLCPQPRELGESRKTRTQRSLFPLTGLAENRGKAQSQADLEHLMTAGDASDADGQRWKHLGLFVGRAELRQLIDMEVVHHETHRSHAQLTQMSVWLGNTAALLTEAAAEARITDELLALAPMVSYRFWEEMSIKYAEQLENSKECVKASSILLACHKVSEAIALLLRHNLHREALSVSRLRLPASDASHGHILRRWAEQLITEGNMEQAAKCYLALEDKAAAAGALSRRSDPGSLRLAARLWTAAGDGRQARALALLCLHTSCLRSEWEVGLAAAREADSLSAGVHLCLAHRELVSAVEESRLQLYPWAVRLLRAYRDQAPAGTELWADQDQPRPGKHGIPASSGQQQGLPPVSQEGQGVTAACAEQTNVLETSKEHSCTVTTSTEGQGLPSKEGAAPTERNTALVKGKVIPAEDEAALVEELAGGVAGEASQEGMASLVEAGTAPAERNAALVEGKITPAERNAAAMEGKVVAGEKEIPTQASLITRVRQTWQAAGVETFDDFEQGIEEVAYRTKPTTGKQLWLSLASELCLASVSPESSDDRLVHMLSVCRENIPSQLAALGSVVVPSASGGVWQTGRRHVLPAVLSVLHHTALQTAGGPAPAEATNGAEVALPPAEDEQSQCAAAPKDGVDAPAGDRAVAMSGDGGAVEVDGTLEECVCLLRALYVDEKTAEEERLMKELAQLVLGAE